jgi:hypothetical protein
MSALTRTATSDSGPLLRQAGFILIGEFNDGAVSGADPIEIRLGFAVLLDRIEANGVSTVIVGDDRGSPASW